MRNRKPSKGSGVTAIPGPASDRWWWKDVVVVTHRPLDVEEGGVTATLRCVERERGIRWHWVLNTTRAPAALDAPLVLLNGAFSLDSRAAREVLKRRNKAGRPTIVYWHETSLLMRRLAGAESPPTSMTRRRRKSWRRLHPLLVDRHVVHCTVSRSAKAALVGVTGVDPRRVFVVYNALSPVALTRNRARPDGELRIATAGGNTPLKNAGAFVGLATSERGLSLPTVWTWFGHNDVATACPQVITPGFCTPLTEALADHDVFVGLSLEEGFGLAALEALSVGLPVIVLQSHGLAEFLPAEWVAHCEADVFEILEGWLAGRWPEPETSQAIAAAFTADAWMDSMERVVRHLRKA